MATFISKIELTDQGMKNIKDSCKRAEDFRSAAAKMGVEVKNLYWTMGPFDGIIVFDAPDAATATAAMLHLGSFGNVHTETAVAYEVDDMNGILGKL
jgi:uncharacterized protein with GYD domain